MLSKNDLSISRLLTPPKSKIKNFGIISNVHLIYKGKLHILQACLIGSEYPKTHWLIELNEFVPVLSTTDEELWI